MATPRAGTGAGEQGSNSTAAMPIPEALHASSTRTHAASVPTPPRFSSDFKRVPCTVQDTLIWMQPPSTVQAADITTVCLHPPHQLTGCQLFSCSTTRRDMSIGDMEDTPCRLHHAPQSLVHTHPLGSKGSAIVTLCCTALCEQQRAKGDPRPGNKENTPAAKQQQQPPPSNCSRCCKQPPKARGSYSQVHRCAVQQVWGC